MTAPHFASARNTSPRNELDLDVIVVGAGHAGTEAAVAAARLVQINLATGPDDELSTRADMAARAATAAREVALAST